MNINELILAGIDTDELFSRIMNNEKLVSLLLGKFLEDKNYEDLKIAFLKEDVAAAELASHTLKGMCGNLSQKRLFALFRDQVLLIRDGRLDDAKAMMNEIEKEFSNAVTHIKLWLAE